MDSLHDISIRNVQNCYFTGDVVRIGVDIKILSTSDSDLIDKMSITLRGRERTKIRGETSIYEYRKTSKLYAC